MNAVPPLLASPVPWTAAILIALYWIAASVVPNAPLMEALRIVQITIAIVVVVAYAPDAFVAARTRRPDLAQHLIMGICLGFTAMVLNGLWSLLWRLGGQPMEMVNSSLNGFWIYLTILAGTLHVTAPGAIGDKVPRRNKIMLGLALGAGAMLALVLVATRPNVDRLIEILQPLFPQR